MPSQQEHTQAGAALGHDEDCLPGFGPAEPTVDVNPPGTPPVGANQIVNNDASANCRLELFINKVTLHPR